MAGKEDGPPAHRKKPVREVPSRFMESADQAAERRARAASRRSHGSSTAAVTRPLNSSERTAPTVAKPGKSAPASSSSKACSFAPSTAAPKLKELQAARDEWRAVFSVLQDTYHREEQAEDLALQQLRCRVDQEELILATERQDLDQERALFKEDVFLKQGGLDVVSQLRCTWKQKSHIAADKVEAAAEQRHYVNVSDVACAKSNTEEFTRALLECAQNHTRALSALVDEMSPGGDQLNQVTPLLNELATAVQESADSYRLAAQSVAAFRGERMNKESLAGQVQDVETLQRFSGDAGGEKVP